ncbi:MAG: homoserine O-acetyltransferase [Sedimentisphaerales bacterium]|nr:homoserine O-acetyltransferase [Sedimentisphaerales bacterium]
MTDTKENSIGFVKTQTLRVVEKDNPLTLECGKSLGPIDVAYETYGRIDANGDNVILICHALSGNAHVAGLHTPNDRKPGWWDNMVGPGKGIDTNKYFVICSNFLGGCSGTTGPSSLNHKTGKPYGLGFPIITVADMVRVQKLLLDKLGVKKLLAVMGGSIGGMQVLQWAILYPDFVRAAIPIATTSHLSAQSIAFDAVGRNAILADPNFAAGQYSKQPAEGLGIARMIGHITYLSEESMRAKFGRKLRSAENYMYDFDSEFAVETYLDYQGQSFAERFDANSYLYITRASDYFDLVKDYGSLEKAFADVKSRFFVVSLSSDWLFTPLQSKEIVEALAANRKDVSYCNIASPYGHDAFLLEVEALGQFLCCFLKAAYDPKNNKPCSCYTRQSRGVSFLDEQPHRARVDYGLIESLIASNSSVLDVGCGQGELLANLLRDKNIKGEGIELEQNLVLDCICRRIPVIQQDVERGLNFYADKSFDYVILSQTVQTLKNPEKALLELLRIGKKVIVSFPNFAHWRCRLQMALFGKAPVTGQLPFEWYNSPNLHFFTLKDFDRFCDKLGVRIESKIAFSTRPLKFAPNLRAEQAVYVIKKD